MSKIMIYTTCVEWKASAVCRFEYKWHMSAIAFYEKSIARSATVNINPQQITYPVLGLRLGVGYVIELPFSIYRSEMGTHNGTLWIHKWENGKMGLKINCGWNRCVPSHACMTVFSRSELKMRLQIRWFSVCYCLETILLANIYVSNVNRIGKGAQ